LHDEDNRENDEIALLYPKNKNRLAKPSGQNLVAGAGFEPTTFGL
jgi:hypothetical protein